MQRLKKTKDNVLLGCIAFLINRLSKEACEGLAQFLLRSLGYSVISINDVDVNELKEIKYAEHKNDYH